MLPKGERNRLRNQEINFRRIRHNLQKKGGVWDE